jgi:hypothetical protein
MNLQKKRVYVIINADGESQSPSFSQSASSAFAIWRGWNLGYIITHFSRFAKPSSSHLQERWLYA